VLLRIGNMRGVDLSIFDFDYDLQWHALMLSSSGAVLGRFGGRDAETPAKYQTLPGLRHALESALVHFRTEKPTNPPTHKPVRAEDYPAAERLHDSACIHCHHVNEFRRDLLQRQGKWSLDEVWAYPQPDNLGLTMDLDKGDRVLKVQPKSLAATLGIRAKDTLVRVDGRPIASIADLQYALHKAPKKGELPIAWKSVAGESKGTVSLADGWRKTDVSWRWSLKSLSPNPSLIGDDVSPDDRKKLGLEARQLAYRQMNFLSPAARHAGLQANDIILGIGDQPMTLTARQFEMHIRLNYRVGDEVTLNVLRGKERLKVKLKLPE
jgi:serine protease Do